jgi:hypothetical protein
LRERGWKRLDGEQNQTVAWETEPFSGNAALCLIFGFETFTAPCIFAKHL